MKKKPVGRPIGFMLGRPPSPSPSPQSPHMYPTSPFVHRLQTSPPNNGGSLFPNQNPSPPSDLGGMLQVLSGGKGELDLGSTLANAQKMIGVINQVAPIVKNLSPMLNLLKGLNTSGTATVSNKTSTVAKVRTNKRKSKARQKRRSSKKTRNYRFTN
jgi:hypothetical protein